MELAKALSLRFTQLTPPVTPHALAPLPSPPATPPLTQTTPTLPLGHSWLDQLSHHTNYGKSYNGKYNGNPGLLTVCTNIVDDDPSWPVLKLETHPSTLGSPLQSSSPPITTNMFSPSSSSSCNDVSGVQSPLPPAWPQGVEWGPVYSEDEDLHKAIQDSLQDSQSNPTSPGMSADKRRVDCVTSENFDTDSIDDIARLMSNIDSGSTERVSPAHRGDMLVIGHHPSRLGRSSRSRDQFVGQAFNYRADTATPLQQSRFPALGHHDSHRKNTASNEKQNMLEFSGPFFPHVTTRPQDTPRPPPGSPVDEDRREKPLPHSLRQLLDSNERLGSNV